VNGGARRTCAACGSCDARRAAGVARRAAGVARRAAGAARQSSHSQ
jgi:hypothetical protein